MIYLDGRRCDGVSDDHLGRRGGRRSLIRARASLPPSKCNFRIAVGERFWLKRTSVTSLSGISRASQSVGQVLMKGLDYFASTKSISF
jgi:hypothetical protein